MLSTMACLPERVCCVVCGRTVPAGEARTVDICGPVSICSRCPDLETGWRSWQEPPGEHPRQPWDREPTAVDGPPREPSAGA
jgi:hypothetical protein